MSRVAFKQCDVQRLVRAYRKEGVAAVVRVDAQTGDLIARPVDPAEIGNKPAEDEKDFWDTWDGH
jgi:hypothetical protein